MTTPAQPVGTRSKQQQSMTVRFATFNTSLNRPTSGALIADLSTGKNAQAHAVAEIIQRTRPDVLVLQEFDHDKSGRAVSLFKRDYLEVNHGEARAITYDHVWIPTVNTGLPSGHDLSGDGRIDGPADAHGYGAHHGQYGFVILSKFPIQHDDIRTFQTFLWRDMPRAKLPSRPGPGQQPFYSKKALEILRLSSKNHVDVPIDIQGQTIHLLVAHPTPPVFDGPENRNG
ncbi:MAG: endonuclease/exonuclease/phosphatase family protein, partial [Pseudomonadota bacterium]|nr:endonuclease/exonuclease/phosphatase family protein [Pseudomonadota bacterium]